MTLKELILKKLPDNPYVRDLVDLLQMTRQPLPIIKKEGLKNPIYAKLPEWGIYCEFAHTLDYGVSDGFVGEFKNRRIVIIAETKPTREFIRNELKKGGYFDVDDMKVKLL